MESVRDHYDRFLGSVYSWILGDFENARRRNAAFFRSLNLNPKAGRVAVDLGSGPGCQSLPLAKLGYQVLAVDFCRALVDELAEHAGDLPIRAVCDDITAFRSHMSEPANLIVCMGDTLVHLPSQSVVDTVIRDVCESLQPGGQFVYAIRDYISFVPQGVERFVPIRASDDRIFTCFLDYGEDSVHVHDILHKKIDGEWQTGISDYLKLRLDTDRINRALESGGLRIVDKSIADGMITVIAEKPA